LCSDFIYLLFLFIYLFWIESRGFAQSQPQTSILPIPASQVAETTGVSLNVSCRMIHFHCRLIQLNFRCGHV
jgi:hypothetical protein